MVWNDWRVERNLRLAVRLKVNMKITVQPRREEAIRAGHAVLADRISIPLDAFSNALEPWNVDAFCDGDMVVGMLMTRGAELHVAVLPECAGVGCEFRIFKKR